MVAGRNRIARVRRARTLANVKLLIERGAPLDAANSRGRYAAGRGDPGLEEQSEWTPNEYTIEIAAALIDAGARVELVKMTLAAAVCLGRADDVARLAPGAERQGPSNGVGRGGVSRSGKCHPAC